GKASRRFRRDSLGRRKRARFATTAPAAGVPASVPVPFPLSVNVTPLGKAPVLLSVGVGDPVAVTVNSPAAPTVNVVLLALVIAGATGPVVRIPNALSCV